MKDNLFISQKNDVSNRFAIFEEDDHAGWLYLTEVNATKPIADCWIYNKEKALKFSDLKRNIPIPPPASIEFVGENYLKPNIDESNISFKWSKDGHSVILLINDLPMGFIIFGEKGGYSRNLIKKCDWGKAFDKNKYQLYFGDGTELV